MTYAVQEFDYAGLVGRMADAGLEGMGKVLVETLGGLPAPQWQNEQTYFWTSLFNAARANDGVWLWLCAQPHIRHLGPSTAHAYPQFVDEKGLPEIGGPDDKRLSEEDVERPEQWPDEPTEENFFAQAEALDRRLQALALADPEGAAVTNIAEYVASFYHSGTGAMMAQIQLTENGFHALATPEGIDFLRETYPPK